MQDKIMANKKANKGIVAVLTAAAVSVCAAGGTMAYLTDHAEVKNTFTVGKIEIEGKEPHWDPDGDGEEGGIAEDVVPTQSFPKDPFIKNVGKNDAYVYIEVEVPMANAAYTDAKGILKNSAKDSAIELFEFDAEGKTVQTLTEGVGVSEVNDKWTQICKKEQDGKAIYTYCYQEALRPNEETTRLFDKITFANVVEGQLDGVTLDVNVHFYAIQTLHTEEQGETTVEKAMEAYEKYMAQNGGSSLTDASEEEK